MGVDQGKLIPGYENYLAYENGSIYSLKRKIFLKPIKHQTGYYTVTLYKNGKGKQMSIHRIIAEIFLPNPDSLPEVDHIDCDPGNNNVNNLRWISREDNLERSFELKHQNKNKVKVKQFDLNGNFIKEYKSEADAFRETGIRHISEAVQKHYKTAGEYVWERSDDLLA